MAEKISRAQQTAIDWIRDHKAVELGALGTEIGKMLAELTVELADEKLKAQKFELERNQLRAAMKVAIAVAMAKLKTRRLVVTKDRYLSVLGKELVATHPDERTIVYELKDAAPSATPVTPSQEVGRILRAT